MKTTVNSGASLTDVYEQARADMGRISAEVPKRNPGETDSEYQERLRVYTATISTAAARIPRR